MQRNLLQYLECTAEKCPGKAAFSDGTLTLTYGEVYAAARAIGSVLCEKGCRRAAVAVFLPRGPRTIAAFLGVLYAGGCYIPLEEEMSSARIGMILEQAAPKAAVCDEKTAAVLAALGFAGEVILYAEAGAAPIDEAALLAVRECALDADPAYIVFTSGSTGVPKGVAASHRNVIDYVEALSDVLGVCEETVFGMQVPLYVDACLKEIYPVIRAGATTYLIPKSLFLFPVKLVEYLNAHRINTVCWVVSALTLISGFGALQNNVPAHLHTVAFGSEVFPIKQFNLWRAALPKARLINLYGPTEGTGMSCYYEVDRDFAEGEAIPIGRAMPNSEVFLLSETGERVEQAGQAGEIYIRGAGVTLGYYRDARTAESYVQNPLHRDYPETVYRTGDMAMYNERGELVYLSRRDYQIKHMGYRIELMEIEAAAARLDGVGAAACVFCAQRDKIVLFYAGDGEEKAVMLALRKSLPRYMAPAAVHRLPVLPYTSNGKVDRAGLTARAEEMSNAP